MKAINQVKLLNDTGVIYHNFGVVKQGRKKLFDYYKVDKITIEQKIKLILHGCDIKYSFKEYAPELRSVLIFFKKEGK